MSDTPIYLDDTRTPQELSLIHISSLDNLQALFACHGRPDVAQQPDPRLAIDQAMVCLLYTSRCV